MDKLLHEETRKLWYFLRPQPALQGFALIGGTALTLQIGHRLSKDLNFAYNAVRLPSKPVDTITRALELAGFRWQPNDDITALQQCGLAGIRLGDFQRRVLVNDIVKVTFLAPDEHIRNVLKPFSESELRVATLDELFAIKALITAKRSESHDWFDLYILMKDHGYTMFDLKDAFDRSGHSEQFHYAVLRLMSCKKSAKEEGLVQVIQTPARLEDIKEFFTRAVDEFEVETASEQSPTRQKFREKYSYLAWSNRNAEDDVLLCKALLDPRFDQIQHAVNEFGIEKLRSLWANLLIQHPTEANAVQPHTERMLNNIARAISKIRRENGAGIQDK